MSVRLREGFSLSLELFSLISKKVRILGYSKALTRYLLSLPKNLVTIEYRNKYHIISYLATTESNFGLKIIHIITTLS